MKKSYLYEKLRMSMWLSKNLTKILLSFENRAPRVREEIEWGTKMRQFTETLFSQYIDNKKL